MKKLQKIQLISCIIPYLSTLFIFFVTYWFCFIKYKNKRALFIGFSVLALFIGFMTNELLSPYLFSWLVKIIGGVLLLVPNYFMIRIQVQLITANENAQPSTEDTN